MGIGTITMVSAVFALWWDLGAVHSLHNADDLVPVMASLWHWMPFYWGEDRFGMPLALVASPFKDPLTNMLVQNWLSSFLGFLGLALLPACVAGKAGIPAGLLGAGIFIALSPARAVFEWFGTGQCYGTAMGFGAAGLALVNMAEKPGKLPAGICILLAFLSIWTNSAMILVLLPLSVFMAWTSRRDNRPGQAHILVLVGIAMSFAFIWLVMRSWGVRRAYSIIPPAEWPGAWGVMAGALWAGLLHAGMVVALGAGLLAGLAAAVFSPASRRTLTASLALLLAGAAYFTGVAVVGWVADRAGDARYSLPVLALLVSSAGLAVSANPPFRKAVPMALVFLALVLGTGKHAGMPDPAGIRARLDRSIGSATPDILRLGVTHLAGEYSRVWPAVFHANMVLHRQDPAKTVWALAFRSAPARPLWKGSDPRKWKIAVLRGDTGLTTFSPELKGARKIAQTPAISVWRPAVK